jgi:hypothetical protein
MRSAVSAQERPANNALTVGVSCVNPTLKPVADAARPSACLAFSSIKRRSTRNPHIQNVENEKELNAYPNRLLVTAFSIAVPSFVHLSSALYLATATVRPYRSYLPHG